jgi:hypothetical protein
MFAQVSADVRTLFSELGIPNDGADVLVIERFGQWHDAADAVVRGTVGSCFSCVAESEEWAEAA